MTAETQPQAAPSKTSESSGPQETARSNERLTTQEDAALLKGKEVADANDQNSGRSSSPPVFKMALEGHTSSVASVKLSPDGSLIASASLGVSSSPVLTVELDQILQAATGLDVRDKSIIIWDSTSGAILNRLTGNARGLCDVAWSPDNRYVCSASDDTQLIIFNVKTGEAVKTLVGHTSYVFCVNYNPAGNLIVSGSFDESIRIWDARKGKSLRTLPAHSDPVSAVHFNRDGTMIVSGSYDGLIRLWDAATGQCLKTLVDDDNPPIAHLKFSPNGKYILSSTLDNTIRLWNYHSGKCVKMYSGRQNERYSLFASFYLRPDGKHWIVSGSEDRSIYVWDLQSKKVIHVLEGHTTVPIALDCHAEQGLMVSGGLQPDFSLKVWHIPPPR